MSDNNVHIKVARATFTVDGQPDTEVRVLPDPISGGWSFSINFGGTDVINSGYIPKDRDLQLAESLQFIADTVSTAVPGRMSPFVRGWVGLSADINHNIRAKGFWPENPEDDHLVNDAEKLCLVHAEISEALEGLRAKNPPDDKLPEFTSVEVELADAVIRIMDLGHARGWRIAQAIEAKTRYNTTRPHKHGKEF